MDDSSQAPIGTQLPSTPRTIVRRRPQRGSHDRALIDAILDEALVCHIGVVIDGAPRVLPTAHVRAGDFVYVHGSRSNRLLGAMVGAEVALTVTLLDGLVMSRSAYHHSMNYRSVVLYGRGREVTNDTEKRSALEALVEHIAVGRSQETPAPTEAELRSTLVVRLPITEGSAKVRSGPPGDAVAGEPDPCWAGEIPLRLSALPPRREPQLAPSQAITPALRARLSQLGLGPRAPFERFEGELLISTDPARLDLARVHAFLRDESYWARGLSEAAFATSLEHALCFGLYRGGEQLGFARVVTDFARLAYIGDVFVVQGARGQGLGKLLTQAILTHPELARVERFVLATADAHGFYERHGFRVATAGRYLVREPLVREP